MSVSSDFCQVSFPLNSFLVVAIRGNEESFFVHVPRYSPPLIRPNHGNSKNLLPFHAAKQADVGYSTYALQGSDFQRFQYINNRPIAKIWSRLLEEKILPFSDLQNRDIRICYNSFLDELLFPPPEQRREGFVYKKYEDSKIFMIYAIALLTLIGLVHINI